MTTPLSTSYTDNATVVNAEFLALWASTINNNFALVEGGGESSVVNVMSHGAVGNGTTNDTTAIQATLDAAATSRGAVVMPKGTYKINATLVVPTGVSVSGAGAKHTIITTTAAIEMFQVGSMPDGSGDRYGTISGIGLDGGNVATVGFDLVATCVMRTFISLEARNINGYGYRLDATQNCVFMACHTDSCDYGWAYLNDAGNNTSVMCETAASNIKSLIYDDDTGLPGYALTWSGHAGPESNHFIDCLYEYGTGTHYLDLAKGTGGVWDNCKFTSYGNTNAQVLVNIGANAHFHEFRNCKYNAYSAEHAGYEDFEVIIRNAGYRNQVTGGIVTCVDLDTGIWLETTTTIEIDPLPHLAGPYRIDYTGVGDARQIGIRPKGDQTYGPTASRPDFGADTGWWLYFDTDLGYPIMWDGHAWVDFVATFGGGGGGAANLTTSRTATTVTVASDTGTDATIPAADSSNAGVMTAAQKTKLDGLASEFTYTQASPAATWTITNTLGRYPSSVSVWIGNELVDTVVETPDVSTIVITFASAQSGRAEII